MRTLALYFDGKYSDMSVNLWEKKHSITGMHMNWYTIATTSKELNGFEIIKNVEFSSILSFFRMYWLLWCSLTCLSLNIKFKSNNYKQFTMFYIVIKIDFVAPALFSMVCSHWSIMTSTLNADFNGYNDIMHKCSYSPKPRTNIYTDTDFHFVLYNILSVLFYVSVSVSVNAP